MGDPLIGPAGEHAVMAELLQRGFTAALPHAGAPSVDILATKSRPISIQVKSNRTRQVRWPISGGVVAKDPPDTHFVIGVIFQDVGVRPIYYVIPGKIVYRYARLRHHLWGRSPGLKGQQRDITGSMRLFELRVKHRAKWLERWDLLS